MIAFAVALVMSAHGAAAAPLDAYGQLPSLENVAISPDGTRLAFVTSINGQRQILISGIADHKLYADLGAGKQKIRALQWAGSENLLIVTSVTTTIMELSGPAREYYLVQSYDVAHKKALPFLDGAKNAGEMLNTVVGMPAVRTFKGRPTAFVHGVHFRGDQGFLGLFRIDVATGQGTLIEEGSKFTNDWVIGADGAVLAREDYDNKKRRWSMHIRSEKGAWAERYAVDAPIDQPSLMGLAPKGEAILVGEMKEGEYGLTAVSMADGARLGAVGDTGYSDFIYDPVTCRMIGGAHVGATVEYEFFDPRDQAIWKGIAKAYPGEVVRLESWSDDRKKIVVRIDGPKNGASFSLVDMTTRDSAWIGDLYEGLKATDISPVQTVDYKAADGLEITSYLTLPRDREAKRLPLVVLVHGGPAARDEPEFDWWSQALASQGYAVFQPQFRGSDGFGQKFMEAGYGQWGRKMQSDLSDGVRQLVKDGIVDPARVCVVGASYGGYAALAGAAFDGDFYRCAASVAGLSDLRKFLSWRASLSNASDNVTLRYWNRFMGSDNQRDPALSAISPADHIDKIHIPILLVHGKDDTVVDYEQSRLMANALTRAGKPVTFVTLNAEDHWLSREPTRKQMLKAVVDFLKANNPPG